MANRVKLVKFFLPISCAGFLFHGEGMRQNRRELWEGPSARFLHVHICTVVTVHPFEEG
jgi:hypothetical protein